MSEDEKRILILDASKLGPPTGKYRLPVDEPFPMHEALERIAASHDASSMGVEVVSSGPINVQLGYFANPARPSGPDTLSLSKHIRYHFDPFCFVYEGVKSLGNPHVHGYETLRTQERSSLGELHLVRGVLWQNFDRTGKMHRVPTREALHETLSELIFDETVKYDVLKRAMRRVAALGSARVLN